VAGSEPDRRTSFAFFGRPYAGRVLVSVPQVDVIPDGFDWANTFTGLGGFVAAVVAIILARRAQKTADSAITDERRRVFELEILRALMKDLDETNVVELVFAAPGELSRYKLRLELLSSTLPFWEEVMTLPDSAAVVAAVGLGPEYRTSVQAMENARLWRAASWPVQQALEQALTDRPGVRGRASGNDMTQSYRRTLRDAGLGDEDRDTWTKHHQDLEKQRQALMDTESTAREDIEAIRSAAKARLAEKLAYDVRQLVLSRVEARQHERLSWWKYRI
jgi:hypothetical protein